MYNNVKNKNIQNVDSNINNESESDNSVKDNISEEKITSSSNLQDEYLEDGQEDDELETIKKAVNEQLKDGLPVHRRRALRAGPRGAGRL